MSQYLSLVECHPLNLEILHSKREENEFKDVLIWNSDPNSAHLPFSEESSKTLSLVTFNLEMDHTKTLLKIHSPSSQTNKTEILISLHNINQLPSLVSFFLDPPHH